MKLKIEVPGEAIAKQRPRATVIGGHAKIYTPKETINYESYIKYIFSQKYPNFVPLESPISMAIHIFKTIPSSQSEKRKELMRKQEIKPTTKPDIDNVAKLISDALNKLAYKDDNQIIELYVKKYYSDYPEVVIEIEEL